MAAERAADRQHNSETHPEASGSIARANTLQSSQTASDWSHAVADLAGRRIVQCPAVLCSTCILLMLSIAGIAFASGEVHFTHEGPKDWDVLDNQFVMTRDAIELAEGDVNCVQAPDPCPKVSERSQGTSRYIGVIFVFESPDDADGIFTPPRIQEVCKMERMVTGSPEYPDFCPLLPGALEAVETAKGRFNISHCQPQLLSITELVYRAAGRDPLLCELLTFDEVRAVSAGLYAKLRNPDNDLTSGFFIGSDVSTDGTYSGGQTRRTRSSIRLGYPLRGRQDSERSLSFPSVQKLYRDGFHSKLEEALLAHFGHQHGSMRSAFWEHFESNDIELIFHSLPIFQADFSRVINSDMVFCIFAIIFGWSYMTYHTGSIFLATVSLFQIIVSFPISFCICRWVFRITHYTQLHGVLLFIILGIGVDDVFVFSDGWRQSRQFVTDSMGGGDTLQVVSHRISYAYRHTMLAVLNTSATTIVAFAAAVVSPIMPIQSMAVFATVLIFLNFVLVITLTPTAFAAHHLYKLELRGPQICRSGTRKHMEEVPEAAKQTEVVGAADGVRPARMAKVANSEAFPAVPCFGSLRCKLPCPGRCRPGAQDLATVDPPAGRERVGSVRKWRGTPRTGTSWLVEHWVVPLLKRPAVSVILATVLAAWGVVNFIFAMRLESPARAFALYDDGHMRRRAQLVSDDGFAAFAVQTYNTVTISFGVAGVDREASPGVDKWRPHRWFGIPEYDAGFDMSTNESQNFLRSFCRDLRTASCEAPGCAPGGRLVLSPDSVSCFIEEFDKWNSGVQYTGDAFKSRLLQFRRTTVSNHAAYRGPWDKAIGMVHDELRFVQVHAKMSLLTFQGSKTSAPVLDSLKGFLDSERSSAPASMGTIIQSVPFDWAWLSTNEGLISGMYSGFAISFPAVFLVLLFATKNIIISTLAFITVTLIVANVLGYCYFAGWHLGPGECVAGTIVIGLAVDYTIHLGHMYLEAAVRGCETRAERSEFALHTMGITVIAGAATTFFASVIMMFCQLRFFIQMSTLIVLTVTYSVVYAFFGFMAVLRLVGPQGTDGDIVHILQRFRQRAAACCGRGAEADAPPESPAELYPASV